MKIDFNRRLKNTFDFRLFTFDFRGFRIPDFKMDIDFDGRISISFDFRLRTFDFPSSLCATFNFGLRTLDFGLWTLDFLESFSRNYIPVNFFFSPSKVTEASCMRQSSTSRRWFWEVLYLRSQSLAISMKVSQVLASALRHCSA